MKTFLPKWFSKEVPWFHRGIIAILLRRCDFLLGYEHLDKILSNFLYKENPEDPQSPELPIFRIEQDSETGNPCLVMEVSKYTLIKIPRGYSKTTIVNAMVLFMIVYGLVKYPVYVSETATHADTQLSTIRMELETNAKLKEVYGNLKPALTSGLSWAGGRLQTTTGITIDATGRGGQIRGRNVSATRPDLIIMDDVEDKESVKTEEQRQKTLQWFFGDVQPALQEIGENDVTVFALGTLLHKEALLQKLSMNKEWVSISFGAIDRQGEALWNLHHSLDKLQQKKAYYARNGMLNVFYLEYFNRIRNEDTSLFKEKYIQHRLVDRKELAAVALALDPAISDKDEACFSAICVAGMCKDGTIQILDFWEKVGATLREQIDMFFDLSFKWEPTFHGIESVAFQASLIHTVKEEMFRKNKYLGEIIPITHKTQKDKRIRGILQPRYASGYIYHQRRFAEYESQLLDYPNGKVDCPDVASMAISLLDPYAAQATDPNTDLAKDCYEPLTKVLGNNWASNLYV